MLLSCKTSVETEIMGNNLIKVTGGLIKGYTSQDEVVKIYKGIPYAASTGGQNRFKAPLDVEPWDNVRDCTNWGDSAVQNPQFTTKPQMEAFIVSNKTYSEDCLNLNVWTTGTSGKKSVILFIHGGGYTSGGSSCDVYDGEAIARKGVVYVSINYRLGIFGFLATSDLEAENNGCGNYALLDLIKGLEWIRDNIASFGGDSGNVTIMGQSAGSGMVQGLIASPKAKGLFQRALAESLNAIMIPFADSVQDRAARGDDLNLSPDDLRSMNTKEVFDLPWTGVSPAFGTEVMPYDLENAYNNGIANDVDLMSGFVEGDFLLYHLLGYGVGNITDSSKLAEENMMASQLALAKATETSGYKGNVYLYYYTYVMPGPVVEDPGLYDYGAFHTSDVPYFLNHLSDSRALYWTDTDRKFADIMSDYLVNFAKTGNPNGTVPTVWETARKSGSYFILNTDPKMR
jgi:para-nitrobenzyl esterase